MSSNYYWGEDRWMSLIGGECPVPPGAIYDNRSKFPPPHYVPARPGNSVHSPVNNPWSSALAIPTPPRKEPLSSGYQKRPTTYTPAMQAAYLAYKDDQQARSNAATAYRHDFLNNFGTQNPQYPQILAQPARDVARLANTQGKPVNEIPN